MRAIRQIENILRRPQWKKYALNTGWAFFGRLAAFPINLLVAAVMARYLGTERFGILSFAMGLVGLFTPVAALGQDTILVREMVRDPGRRNVLVTTSLGMRVMSGALLALGIAAISDKFGLSETEYWITVICSLTLVAQAGSVFRCYFEAAVKVKFVSKALLVQTVLSAILKLLLVLSGASLYLFAVTSVLDAIVLAAMLHLFYKGEESIRGFRLGKFDPGVASHLMRRSWPLMLQGVALVAYMKLDKVMIMALLSPADVGIYSAAVQISESWLFIATIMTTSLYPAILSAQERGPELFQRVLSDFYGLMVWSSILIAVPLIAFSDFLVAVVFGSEYAPAAGVVAIHAWSGIFVFVITASSRWYLAHDCESSLLYRAVVGALSNIGLNFLLIPPFGIMGAAYATVISYGIMAFPYDLFDPIGRKGLGLKVRALIWPLTLARSALKL